MEKTEVVVVSSKGQVVIPQSVRNKLGIGAKSKLLVYPYEDALIMKKLDVSNLEKKLEKLYQRVDARREKYGTLTQEEIQLEIERYRREKKRRRN